MAELTREKLLMALIAGRGPAYLRGVNLSSLDLSTAGWLVEADLRFADLSNANLRRANLRKADLEGANLHAANLLGTNFEGANLFKARANVANLNVSNLRGANLKEITLVGANLVGADLEEADLEGADLEGANLQGSNLRKARLTNVNLKMANLGGVDLTQAIMDSGLRFDLSGKAVDPETEQGFHGSVTSIPLTDLVQLGCLARSNLTVEVHSNARKGYIYIGSGRVLHARTGDLEGEEALFTILGWEGGRFVTYPYNPGGTVSIDKPVEQLLIQSVRLRDENVFERKYSDFIQKIKEYVPVEALASEDLVSFLGKKGKNLSPREKIEVTDVFDSDEGDEILCSVSVQSQAFVAPLKLISLENTHPLFRDLAEFRAQ